MENEKYLFQQIKQGNKRSFEILFKTYYAPLCVFAKKYIYDDDDCEEIVQSFFLKIWEKRTHIEINTSIKNYLFSSIRNRCFNYIKHQKIKSEYQSEMLNTLEVNSNLNTDFIEIDLLDKIKTSIDSLPKRRREIFILSREHGLKYREIAEKLGISIKTVETQMGHALKELRKNLKEYKQYLITFLLTRKIIRVK